MERQDHKIIAEFTYERNYNAGMQTDRTDVSTVELTGTWQEADLLVRGLQALKGQLLLTQATTQRPTPDQQAEITRVDQLLGEIGQPNYVGEPEVRQSRSDLW